MSEGGNTLDDRTFCSVLDQGQETEVGCTRIPCRDLRATERTDSEFVQAVLAKRVPTNDEVRLRLASVGSPAHRTTMSSKVSHEGIQITEQAVGTGISPVICSRSEVFKL